jgi:hypothetical protein
MFFRNLALHNAEKLYPGQMSQNPHATQIRKTPYLE